MSNLFLERVGEPRVNEDGEFVRVKVCTKILEYGALYGVVGWLLDFRNLVRMNY